MKSILIIIILFATGIIYSQNEDLIAQLNSEDLSISIPATEAIIYENVTEAMQDILNLYSNRPAIQQLLFLHALVKFNYFRTNLLALDFIQNVEGLNEQSPPGLTLDPLKAKVEASFILFELQNYSTNQYIFDLFNRDGLNNINAVAFEGLYYILKNVKEKETSARNIFLEIWANNSDSYYRYYSMLYLTEMYGNTYIQNIFNSFINDPDVPIRNMALTYLINYNYANLQSSLRTQLSTDPDPTLRMDIADTLLEHFGEPADLKAVKDYQPNAPNATERSIMSYYLNDFIPPRPAGSISAYNMTTKLMSYTDNLYTYHWILMLSKYNSYKSTLNDIAKYIQRGSISSAISTINTMLNQVEFDYNNTPSITIEAYKFLHYHLQYILDKLQLSRRELK